MDSTQITCKCIPHRNKRVLTSAALTNPLQYTTSMKITLLLVVFLNSYLYGNERLLC